MVVTMSTSNIHKGGGAAHLLMAMFRERKPEKAPKLKAGTGLPDLC